MKAPDIGKVLDICAQFEWMIKLELLAPAKDFEHGKAAIGHGADAVYIGAPKFSARKSAVSTIQDIEELVKYAHLFNAKVYVALNTILYDSELEEARLLIHELYNCGIDALIIQDMGILEMDIPPVPLFASTQTHNATPEKVEFLEKIGFQRVILARELSIKDIEIVRKTTTVDLESFVHGALCVSYSGQCYMSQSICNRSGNRGECAQPCRSPYDLVDSTGKVIVKNKHLLSLKDLNMSNSIANLIRAGISSFKIEGRLKDMGYLKNVVSWYRKQLDEFINRNPAYVKASSGVCTPGFEPDPDKTFNRGYTQYHLEGRKEKLSTLHTQKSVGTKVGEIVKANGNRFTYAGEELHPGDGICFFTANEELKGFLVNKAEGNIITPSSAEEIYPGATLYRNLDIRFENQLKQSHGNRKMKVDLDVLVTLQEMEVTAKDEDGNHVQVKRVLEGIEAENKTMAESMIKTQMVKLGNTPFYLGDFTIKMSGFPFIAASKINDLRRDTIEALLQQRMEGYQRDPLKINANTFPYPQNKLDYRANIANSLARQFYKRHGVHEYEKAFELSHDIKQAELMVTKHCIKYQMDACPRFSKNNVTLPEPVYLKDNHHQYRLVFDCKNCVMKLLKEN